MEGPRGRVRRSGRVRGARGQGPGPLPCAVFDGPQADREAHERTCRETWATAWALEGDTLEEAKQALAERRFLGAAYHLSDCELLDDRPPEDSS